MDETSAVKRRTCSLRKKSAPIRAHDIVHSDRKSDTKYANLSWGTSGQQFGGLSKGQKKVLLFYQKDQQTFLSRQKKKSYDRQSGVTSGIYERSSSPSVVIRANLPCSK